MNLRIPWTIRWTLLAVSLGALLVLVLQPAESPRVLASASPHPGLSDDEWQSIRNQILADQGQTASRLSPAEPYSANSLQIALEAKVSASDGAAQDRFGASVAIDGDTALIGANFANVGGNERQGAAYVFVRNGSNWTQQAKLVVGDGQTYQQAGGKVALSGNTAVVPIHRKVYVFVRSGATWTEQAVLEPQGSAGYGFGSNDVAIDGNTIAVGARLARNDADQAVGGVYIFVRSGETWTQQARILPEGATAFTGVGRALALHGDRLLAGASSEAVSGDEARGAAYLFVRNGEAWSQEAKLVASNGAAGDSFGEAVALQGDQALIGAPAVGVNGNEEQGAVYLFSRSGGSWVQMAALSPDDGKAKDRYGAAVALDNDPALGGTVLLVGIGRFFQKKKGAAYVYSGSGQSWVQEAKLEPADGASGDNFGLAVALDGGRALIGANFHDVNGNDKQGATYIYEIVEPAAEPTATPTVTPTPTPTPTATPERLRAVSDGLITASDGQAEDRFGINVDLDGDTVVVGAPFAQVGGVLRAGAVYVFTRGVSGWTQQAKLTLPTPAVDDRIGNVLALDGDTVLIGIRHRARAYVFSREGSTWSLQAELTSGDSRGYGFGTSVAVEGDTALVGANVARNDSDEAVGAVYVFTRSGATWTQTQRFLASDGLVGDGFGQALALDGNLVLVGASSADVSGNQDQGAAYVFDNSSGAWVEQAKLIAGDGTAGSAFGGALSLKDGLAVVGAPQTAVNGAEYQGAVYVFQHRAGRSGRLTGADWTFQAKLTASDGKAGDFLGTSVDQYGDFIGAGIVESSSNLPGAAYFFIRDGSTWTEGIRLTSDEASLGSRFGASLSMDGQRVAVGSYFQKVGQQDLQGAAQVFWLLEPPFVTPTPTPQATPTPTATPAPSTDSSVFLPLLVKSH